MQNHSTINTGSAWYELFSRGARDWLRHNQKVREAVQENLPELISHPDIITGSQQRTVQIPVHFLEHARFRLNDNRSASSAEAGQGAGKPGDVLHTAQPDSGADEGSGGQGEGEVKLLLELNIDDIMDWLWEEMKLPDLKPKYNSRMAEREMVREGWDKHGARARLDRRRTVKEAVKRRAVQHNPLPFTDEDLRFRQLVQRRKEATNAVVFFALDVSASMTVNERKLAKNFFFFALQGIRRQYAKVEIRFIAHTTQAWEFSEEDFFQVTGTGGTGASTAFNLALQMIEEEYSPDQYNIYLFYASDGENFTEDHAAASASLEKLAALLNYIGYIETAPGLLRSSETEMKSICNELDSGRHEDTGVIHTSVLTRDEDVWRALRKFFMQQAEQAEAA
jgi:uncharacterized protein